RVRDLRVTFDTLTGPVEAVRGVSFDLRPGRTLALVGESGSGKSVSSFSILRLLPTNARLSGSIVLRDEAGDVDVLELAPKDPRLFAVRGGRAGMIFQEPMTALSPVHRVGEQVAEAVRIHRGAGRRDAWNDAVAMLEKVGIPDAEARARQYPFEFSGGMRQRVVIAMALVCRPKVLIADEPTTALDVTVQAQILDLIAQLREEVGASVLFITHDLGVVAQVADDVAVMRHGRVVEVAPTPDLYRRPLHPYTRKLLRSVPGVPVFETTPRSVLEHLPAGRCVGRVEADVDGETFALTDLGDGRQLLTEAGAGTALPDDIELDVAEPPRETADAPKLLEVRGLTKRFLVKKPGRRNATEVVDAVRTHGPLALIRPPKSYFHAVDDVDLDLRRGETLGLVGESGSGKTTVARCILRALDPTAGSVRFFDPEASGDGVELTDLPAAKLKPLRRRLQMIFQDPFASLNPRMTVADIVGEPLLIHGLGSRSARRKQAAAMLERVGLPTSALSRYPHAFSGGQRQRIGIARALILRPALVVADEATSALDVSIRGQMLALLRELQREMGLTYLFVAHDLSLVRSFCDRVAVMRKGRIVEHGPATQVLERPTHVYTRSLLSAVPEPDPSKPLQPLSIEALATA
ncbi:MAG: ABC transporter ATP-binding protein, partial [Planctomycetota bacterium]